MKSNYEVLTFENLEKYRSFETISEMDEVIYTYIERLRADELPESVIEVLRFFGRSSLRITGVSFAKYLTIAEAVGKSRSTVIRAINTLEEYGMIKRIATVKKWKGRSRKKSVNIIVIQPSLQSVKLQDETSTEGEETNEDKSEEAENVSEPVSYNHSVINYVNTYSNKSYNRPYDRFKSAVTTFIGNGNQSLVSKLYGVYRGQTKELRKAYKDEEESELMDVAIKAIYATFNASKTKNIRNIAGYFNGVLSQLLDDMASNVMAELFAGIA